MWEGTRAKGRKLVGADEAPFPATRGPSSYLYIKVSTRNFNFVLQPLWTKVVVLSQSEDYFP